LADTRPAHRVAHDRADRADAVSLVGVVAVDEGDADHLDTIASLHDKGKGGAVGADQCRGDELKDALSVLPIAQLRPQPRATAVVVMQNEQRDLPLLAQGARDVSHRHLDFVGPARGMADLGGVFHWLCPLFFPGV
jgi:hypothetical protein